MTAAGGPSMPGGQPHHLAGGKDFPKSVSNRVIPPFHQRSA